MNSYNKYLKVHEVDDERTTSRLISSLLIQSIIPHPKFGSILKIRKTLCWPDSSVDSSGYTVEHDIHVREKTDDLNAILDQNKY